MRNLLWVVCLSLGFTTSILAKTLTFGEAVDEGSVTNISTILESPVEYLDQKVTVSGMIVGVCSKRGCWVELASDAKFEKLRIKVRDGDMVFPMTAKGKQAFATGTLTEIKLDLEQTRRYKMSLAKRNGDTLKVDDITEPMAIYQLSPIGVKILD